MSRPECPSFDHIPTEEGRAASRRLWDAAFGAPEESDTPEFEFLIKESLRALRNNLAASSRINRDYDSTFKVGSTVNTRVPLRYRG